MAEQASPMRSLERAIDVLEVLDAAQGPLRLTEIARRAGLPVPTTQRILNVLESRSRVDRDSTGYRPGVALTFGAHAFLSTNPLLRAARPVLIDLAAATGLTASLFLEHGRQRVMLTREGAARRLRYELPVGARLPLYVGAGKVLLAQWPEEELQALFDDDRCPPLGAGGRPLDLGDLRRELKTIRDNGFASSRGEREPGVASVAVALPEPISPRVGLVVSGYEEDLPVGRVAALGVDLQRAALAISRDVLPGAIA